MPIHLIYAKSSNNVIGIDGGLPWSLPEDLAHFKRTTLGAPVIMGRRTWESIPAKFRPLPGRKNIVVSGNMNWQPEGAVRVASLTDASRLVPLGTDAWVIGGARLLEDALVSAKTVVVTEIELTCEGDVYAPVLAPAWIEASRERHQSANGLWYSLVTYSRKAARHRLPPVEIAPTFADRGVWRADITQDKEPHRVFVESDDFAHDARLYVDGDFEGLQDKLDYARGLAAVLNKHRTLAPPAADN